MKLKNILLLVVIGFLLINCHRSEKFNSIEVNFEGRDFTCNLKNEYDKYNLLECVSEDNYLLILGYVGDVKHGPLSLYFPDSSIYIEGMFAMGKQEGVWKEFAKDGELKSFSYVIQDVEFYSKAYNIKDDRFIGHLPVLMETRDLGDSTQIEFILAYSNLDTFFTGGVFNYKIDKDGLMEYSTTSETNTLSFKVPKAYSGTIDVDFLELDTSYSFMGGEELRVIVDSNHSKIELLDNVLSEENNLKIFIEHFEQGKSI